MPFILRNVSLLGVHSVMSALALREIAGSRLERDLDPGLLETITTEVPLTEAIEAAGRLMDQAVRGRIVVRTGA